MARFSATFDLTVTGLALVAGAILGAVAVAIPIDVALRACCSRAVYGLGDLTEHGIAAATFLGAPWVLRKNAHVAIDIATVVLSDQARRRLAIGVDLLGAAISALYFWYTLQALWIAVGRGSMVRGIIVIPEWLTFVAPVMCGALLTVGFVLRLGDRSQPRDTPGL